MDITVTQNTNSTYFVTEGWAPGGYAGIQQTPDTRIVPTGKNLTFSMWDSKAGKVLKMRSKRKCSWHASVGTVQRNLLSNVVSLM